MADDRETNIRITAQDETQRAARTASENLRKVGDTGKRAYADITRTVFTTDAMIKRAAASAGVTVQQFLRLSDATQRWYLKHGQAQQAIKRGYEEQGRAAQRMGQQTEQAFARGRRGATAFNNDLTTMARRYFGAAAAAEAARRSFPGFATTDDKMRTLSRSLAGVGDQTKLFLRNLSRESGVAFDDLIDGMQTFRNASGKNLAEIERMFPQIVQGAKTLGVEVKDFAAAIGAAKVSARDLPGIMDMLTKAQEDFGLSAEDVLKRFPEMARQAQRWGLSYAQVIAMIAREHQRLGNSGEAVGSVANFLEDIASPELAAKLGVTQDRLRRILLTAKQEGKDVLAVLGERIAKAERAGVKFDNLTDTQRAQKDLAMDAYYGNTSRRADDLTSSVGRMGKAFEEKNRGAAKSIQDVLNALKHLGDEFGRLLTAMGTSEGLKSMADEVGRIATAIDQISNVLENVMPQAISKSASEWARWLNPLTRTLDQLYAIAGWLDRKFGKGEGGGFGDRFGTWQPKPEQEKQLRDQLQELGRRLQENTEIIRRQNFTMGGGAPRVMLAGYQPGGGGGIGGGRYGGGRYAIGSGGATQTPTTPSAPPMTGAPGAGAGAVPPMGGAGPAAGGGAPGASAGGLAGARSRFAEELKDPAVRDRLMAYTQAEVGSQGPQAQQAFMETIMNRAASRGQSLKQTLSGSYFPGITHRKAAGGVTEAQRRQYSPMIDQVMGGSNVSNYATGNASGSVGFGGGPTTARIGGEKFGIEAADRRWAAGMQGGGGAGGGLARDMTEAMAPAGTRPGSSAPGGLATITTNSGKKFTVAAAYAENFRGFLNDYEKAGGVIGPDSGGLGSRPGNRSYHPRGMAIDLNQVGYGIRSKRGVTLPQATEDALAAKWGLFPGSQFRSRSDIGHFEVRNAAAARRALAGDRSQTIEDARGTAPEKPHPFLGAKQPDTSGVTADEAQRVRSELEKPVKIKFEREPGEEQFRRASMRTHVNRELREAKWNSYADTGAA